MTELLLIVVIALAPTIVDLLFQFYIHRRSLKKIERTVLGCTQCPYFEGMKDVQ